MTLRLLLMPRLTVILWLGVGYAQHSGQPTPKPKPSPKDDCCVLEPLRPSAPSGTLSAISPSTAMQRLVEGNPTSRVSVIIYEDLQCPDCAEFRKALDEILLPKYGDTVAFEHRDFPLPKHSWAKDAAIASRYFQTLDSKIAVQFRRQVLGRIGATSAMGFRSALIAFSRDNRLDAERALASLTDPTYARPVDKEFQDGVAAGLRRTPTVVIAGQEFVETINIDKIQRVLDALLGNPPQSH
ncbi:MAG: thioredoxin domain-containing protein [Bryobacterales bacterium]|nr:thioredoxin domain-containing protein [Bryobacterales bacterium]